MYLCIRIRKHRLFPQFLSFNYFISKYFLLYSYPHVLICWLCWLKGFMAHLYQPSLLCLSKELFWQLIANVSFGIFSLLVLWPNLLEIYFCAYKCKSKSVREKHFEKFGPLLCDLHIEINQDEHFLYFRPQLTGCAQTLHNGNELLLPLEFHWDFQHIQLTFTFEVKITKSRTILWIVCLGYLKIFKDYLGR